MSKTRMSACFFLATLAGCSLDDTEATRLHLLRVLELFSGVHLRALALPARRVTRLLIGHEIWSVVKF